MNAQQLRNSILQEAIEGHLVPQDPNDEPASVLLERIREEKKRLVKEGKLKKKDLEETPISEDEKPFEIPESWVWIRLADIFEHSSGKQLRASDTEGILREYITTSNLYWGRFELNELKSMYYKDSEIEKCSAQKGDLLVCEGGDIGRSAIWSYDYDICLQNHIHRLRPYDNRYTIFVFYIMWFYKSVGLIGGKGIGIQGLSASALKSIIIPLPPLAEQKRIVAKIEELLPKVEEYGKAQDSLDKLNEELPERLKKSVLQEAIEGRLVPQDPNDEPASVLLNRIREEKKRLVKEGKLKKKDLVETPINDEDIPFEIPKNWGVCRLKAICNDFIVPQRDKPTHFDGDIPWCRIEDIEGKYLNRSLTNQNVSLDLIKKMNMHICPAGTVISACSASIGNQAIITRECCTNQTFIGIVCNDNVLYNEYLYYFLMSQKDNLKKMGKGTTISYISRKKYEDYIFPLPPLAEQKRIVAKIEEVFKEIDKLK